MQGGAEAPPDFKLMYYVYKQLQQNDVQNYIIIEKQERKNSFQVISNVAHMKFKA